LAAKVTVARHSVVKAGVPVSCAVLRKEWAVTAPGTGKYIALVPEGSRVKVDQVFARIEGAGGDYELVAPAAGLIHHGGDGYGDLLPPGVLDAGTAQTAAAVLKNPPASNQQLNVEKGQPVAAVIDNVRFQLVTGQDFHSEGKRQTLVTQLPDGRELSFSISPREVIQHNNLFWVLWDAPALPDSLGLQRVLRGEMVTAELELVLVPEGALYTKDGELGVFILFRSRPIFSPVEVHYSEAGMVGVIGLTNGQRVLSLPKWASFAKGWWE